MRDACLVFTVLRANRNLILSFTLLYMWSFLLHPSGHGASPCAVFCQSGSRGKLRGCFFYKLIIPWKMTGLGIRSFAHRSFAQPIILLKSNERLWANRSDRSRQMSDREQIAQVAQRKWANVSESLRWLKTNEQSLAIRSGHSEEMSEWALWSKMFAKKSKI